MERSSDYSRRVEENRAEILRISAEVGKLRNRVEYLNDKLFASGYSSSPIGDMFLRIRDGITDWNLRRAEARLIALEEELSWCEGEEVFLDELHEMGVL